MSFEVNFDSLVGPTHNYAGLSYGNIASTDSQGSVSNPQAAALQGLEKMRFMASLGLKQGIFPPQRRPLTSVLKTLGYYGEDADVLAKVWKQNPHLLLAISSSAFMWAANSCTVTPSCDNEDPHHARVHFTPANLSSKFHRAIEAGITTKLLKTIFVDLRYFEHHDPLPSGSTFSDEGAANHTCFNRKHGTTGVHLFVYGRQAFHPNISMPKVFPPRQTLEASQAIARLHRLNLNHVLFVQQNPEAIDAGVFHNDVIAVGNNQVLLYHEKAFSNSEHVIDYLEKKVKEQCHISLQTIKVMEKQVSLKEAVDSYLFNSQLVTLPDSTMTLIAPSECQYQPAVKRFLDELIQDPNNPIGQVHYFNLKESMRNGGGPACLRLRVPLTEREFDAVNKNFIYTDELYEKLVHCIKKHYRTSLVAKDLVDPKFLQEIDVCYAALSEIFGIDI